MTKILVADDERATRLILKHILTAEGYEVTEAANGKLAYDIAFQDLPDLILLDVQMPEMDGFEVLAALRANLSTATLRVILLTSYSLEVGEQIGMRFGVSHYIGKPLDPDTVRVTVRVALREERVASYQEVQESIKFENALRDLNLGGGLPIGSLTLIEGTASSGKSVMCQHLAFSALQNQRRVAYITSEDTPNSLVSQMASIGLQVAEYRRSGKLRIHALDEPTPDMDLKLLMDKLAQLIADLLSECEVIIVDSITSFAAYSEDMAITGLFSFCKRQCDDGKTIILTAHSTAFDEKMIVRLGSLCDAQLRLGVTKVGSRLMSILEVCKIHNAELSTGSIVSFRVEPGVGIRVNPIGKINV